MTPTQSSESPLVDDGAPMPARKKDAKALRDVVAVVILSVTAVLTAWCGFAASKWGGEMSIAFSEASSARIQATNFEGRARDARQFDLTIYATWVDAVAQERTDLAEYVETRFTPEFRVAFEQWQADGMVEESPFVLDEYVPEGTEDAAAWTERADQRFADALTNNQRRDNYPLLTVMFALMLFLTAMSQRDAQAWVSRAFLGLAGVTGIAAVIIMSTFPVKI